VAIRAINVRREELVNHLRKINYHTRKTANKLLAFASKTAKTILAAVKKPYTFDPGFWIIEVKKPTPKEWPA
jgi:hypothetical protein